MMQETPFTIPAVLALKLTVATHQVPYNLQILNQVLMNGIMMLLVQM
jgi:hypothetical protein